MKDVLLLECAPGECKEVMHYPENGKNQEPREILGSLLNTQKSNKGDLLSYDRQNEKQSKQLGTE